VSGNGPADPSSPKGPSAPPRAGLPALPSPHGQSAPGGHRHPAHGHPERRKALLPGQRGGRESDRARRGGRAGRTRYLGTLIVADLPPGTKGKVVFAIIFSVSPESILTVTADGETPDVGRARRRARASRRARSARRQERLDVAPVRPARFL